VFTAGGVAAAAALSGYPVFAPLALAPLAFAVLIHARRSTRAGAGPPGGAGPAPPGGAGVREPRRPRPVLPAGAIALPLADEESPAAIA
jgi:hypothetical protein